MQAAISPGLATGPIGVADAAPVHVFSSRSAPRDGFS
jgi:hypothetical protein